jgi:hypothetical protein
MQAKIATMHAFDDPVDFVCQADPDFSEESSSINLKTDSERVASGRFLYQPSICKIVNWPLPPLLGTISAARATTNMSTSILIQTIAAALTIAYVIAWFLRPYMAE